MWLVVIFIFALIATLANFFLPKKFKLGFLSLMLWGATVMVFVDHILGYEGGEFLEKTTDGIIKNGFLLGLVMLVPIFIVWIISLKTNTLVERR